MTMIEFCHIAPTHHIECLTQDNDSHLILAHLVEKDSIYRNYYSLLRDGKPKILDNSAYEMYRQGRPMYSSEKLVRIGEVVRADYIVMSDYPKERGCKTIRAAKNQIMDIKNAGFKTLFVPQSTTGDLDDYVSTFKWGIDHEDVNLVGVSILGAPNAYGVDVDIKGDRFLARWKLMHDLENCGVINYSHKNKLHFLGMTDGAQEIRLLREFHHYIKSWDSSSAVWSGLNGVRYDESPTGLINGKIDLDVDFNKRFESEALIKDALFNIKFIRGILDENQSR